MYIPASFHETELAVAFDLIESHGFATLLSGSAEDPAVSHVPLLLDRPEGGPPRLVGHLARANPHWQRFDGVQAALAIFHGPHAYVSPSWFATHPSVPTWNYAVVHVHGSPRVLPADATHDLLLRTIAKYEGSRAQPWRPDLPRAYLERQVQAIVGFELPIARVEAKFKLSQNKDAADQAGTLEGLAHEPDAGSQELAAFTRRYLARKPL